MAEILAGISNTGKRISAAARNNKKLSLFLLSSFLLATIIIASVSGIAASRKNSYDNSNSTSHAILRSSCSSTQYPDLCFSSIAAAPEMAANLTNPKDVIDASLNLTITAVEHTNFTIERLLNRPGLTRREKTALHDCLMDVDLTLEELHKTKEDLKMYPQKKSLPLHADHMKILLSAAMTNQDSCMDGFSHKKSERELRKELINSLTHVHHLCSNSLAMICNMTDTDMLNAGYTGERRLEEHVAEDGFPTWLSAGDRRLLQASMVMPNVTVAADGSGNYRNVSEAVAAAPTKSSNRYVISIKAGVYRENVEVPKKKTNIMFVGDGRDNTIITGDRNVKDGSTTFNSATVAIVGGGFLARDITFQNTAGPLKHQAVALRVGSDLSAFYQCAILAYQDTLYVHSFRQFYRSCLIAGTVDFIFGNAAVVFQDCDILARLPNPGQKNMVTAQGRDDPNQNTGISIQKCRIGATPDLEPVESSFPTYLGRPWREYSRTVVMQSVISNVINPAGWYEWNGSFALNTLYYGEYQNTGPGAGTANRVKWKGYRVITNATVAQQFTAGSFISGSSWLGSTGFPFILGL
ncbi:pectinesterase [Cinnamomum micranthum f. kanehirae]|uniref:Pectinesterase n=1 Tax=Cinnamomum micranthum f. kanehirae TaxID=337451 RepID=A0A3S3NNW2_9MAGN|nr:pectinesterase [Cinnamomum micranthum f. kanehirae]